MYSQHKGSYTIKTMIGTTLTRVTITTKEHKMLPKFKGSSIDQNNLFLLSEINVEHFLPIYFGFFFTIV